METEAATGAAAGGGIILIELIIIILAITALWKLFTKAGKPGWASIVPFYNTIVLLEIAGKPWWWLFLMMIPFVNLVVSILTIIGLVKNFGRGGGTIVGLILLPIIFLMILGFGSAEYKPVEESQA